MNIPYQVMDSFMIRIPTGTINRFFDLVSNKDVKEKDILNELERDNVLASIFVSSPVLYKKIIDFKEGRLEEVEKKKVIQSYVKYVSRYCSRSTPFGLFSLTFLGSFYEKRSKQEDEYINVSFNKLKFNIRLDFELLHQLLEKKIVVKDKLSNTIYTVNNTFYRINDNIRYLERSVDENKRITYGLIEIESNDILDKILEEAKKSVDLSTLLKIIVEDGYSIEEAQDYINELTDSKLLMSNYNYKILGNDAVNQFVEMYKNSDLNDSNIAEIINDLIVLNGKNTPVFDIGLAQKLSNKVLDVLPDFAEKTIFNIDTYFKSPDVGLPISMKDKIIEALLVLNSCSKKSKGGSTLSSFAKALFKRYEYKEVPLLLALDSNLGIGYPINKKDKLSPLVDDIPFYSAKSEMDRDIYMSSFQQKMLSKLTEAQINNERVIELEKEEIIDNSINWNDLPDTFSTISQICYDEKGNMLLSLEGFAGNSGGNLISRFSYNDNETLDLLKEIDSIEQNLNKDKIIAEINHLVDGRATNILLRPSFREFEIPIYSNSTKLLSNQLLLEDILVSSDGEYLKLRSKTHNKEVVPKLTSAHNFSTSDIPAYLFLCDYQSQKIRPDLYFDLGYLYKLFSYIPRIQYSNIVFSLAKWIIHLDDVKNYFDKDGTVRYEDLIVYLDRKKMDKIVNILDKDSKLLLNLTNKECLDIFIKEVRLKNRVILEEFMFGENSLIRNEEEKPLANEFVFIVKKNV